jgi:hypothetical protein
MKQHTLISTAFILMRMSAATDVLTGIELLKEQANEFIKLKSIKNNFVLSESASPKSYADFTFP